MLHRWVHRFAWLTMLALTTTAFGQSSWPSFNAAPDEGVIPRKGSQAEHIAFDCWLYLHSGEVLLRSEDVRIPGKGLDFSFERTYRSQVTYLGALGANWTHNFDQVVRLDGLGNLEHFDGSRFQVETYAPSAGLYICQEPGVYRKARQVGSSWQIRDAHGTVWTFLPLDGTPAQGRLSRVEDTFGNGLDCYYDASGRLQTVIDTLTRPIQFSYSPSGYLYQLTDFAGRTWTYTQINDELTSVATPPIVGTPVGPGGANDFPNGRITGYTYSSSSTPELDNNIELVIRPNEYPSGDSALKFTYVGDKVDLAKAGGTNSTGIAAGGNYGLSYQSTPTWQTTLTDRRSNPQVFSFDTAGRLSGWSQVTPSGPLASVSKSYLRNADGETTRFIDESGLRTDYQYDNGNADRFAHGRLLVESVHPTAGGTGAKLYRTRLQYEPIYNQALGSVENSETFVLDYQEAGLVGGLLQLVTDWAINTGTYDLTPRGDINGDGTTGQFGGTVVYTESATITTGVVAPTKIARVYTFDSSGRMRSKTTGEGALSVYEYGNNVTEGGQLITVIDDADPSLPGIPANSGTAAWTKPVPHVNATQRYHRNSLGQLVGVTDPNGVEATFTVNVLGEVVLLTEASGTDSSNLDPILASLATISPSLVTPGYRTWTLYDANGNQVRSDTDNIGSGHPNNPYLTTLSAYDIENRLVSAKQEIREDTSGIQWAENIYLYDESGNLFLSADPEVKLMWQTWDERGLLRTRTKAFGTLDAETMTWSYEADGKVAFMESAADLDGDGALERTLYEYDRRRRLVKTISPTGVESISEYDATDSSIGASMYGHPGGPSPTANDTTNNVLLTETQTVRDEAGRVVELKDHLFLPSGQPVSGGLTIPAKWTLVKQTLDRDNLTTERVDQASQTSTWTYDGLGRVLSETDALGTETRYTYDAVGNLKSTTILEKDSAGNSTNETKITLYVHDGLGRLIRQTDTIGNTTYYGHDSRGNLVATTDARGDKINDPLGLFGVGNPSAATQINARGNTRRMVVDGLGRVERYSTDMRPNGVNTTSDTFFVGFDPSIDPPASELAPSPGNPDGMIISTLSWDKNGNLTTLVNDTDDPGASMTFTYDHRNRLSTKTLPDGSSQEVEYYPGGLVKTERMRNPGGSIFRTVTRTYDSDGRLATVTGDVAGASPSVGRTDSYEYNGLSLQTLLSTTHVDPLSLNSTITRVYDSFGRVLQETQNGKLVQCAWDDVGRRTQTLYPNGRQIDVLRDSLGRIDEISDGALIARYRYLGRQRLADVEFGNGTRRSYLTPIPGNDGVFGYDFLGRPNLVEQVDPLGNIVGVSADFYDRFGNRGFNIRQSGPSAPLVGDQALYDSAQRLYFFDREIGAGSPLSITSYYDLNADSSMRDLYMATGGNVNVYSFIRNVVWAYDSIAGYSLTHDVAGNRRSDEWFDYVHDALDRLIVVRDRATQQEVLRYSYDATGRRTEKIFVRGSAAERRTRYYYDEDQVIEERDASDTVVAQYVWGGATDEVLQMSRPGWSGTPYYFGINTLGSIVALTDGSGATVERYSYGGFGTPAFLDPAGAQSGAFTSLFGNPYLFTGREYDSELAEWKLAQGSLASYYSEVTMPVGIYYYRARYYDPQEARFTGRDQLSVSGNTTIDPSYLVRRVLGANRTFSGPYAYVDGNPLNRTDPSGNEAECSVCVPVPPDLSDVADSAAIRELKKMRGETFTPSDCVPPRFEHSTKMIDGKDEGGGVFGTLAACLDWVGSAWCEYTPLWPGSQSQENAWRNHMSECNSAALENWRGTCFDPVESFTLNGPREARLHPKCKGATPPPKAGGGPTTGGPSGPSAPRPYEPPSSCLPGAGDCGRYMAVSTSPLCCPTSKPTTPGPTGPSTGGPSGPSGPSGPTTPGPSGPSGSGPSGPSGGDGPKKDDEPKPAATSYFHATEAPTSCMRALSNGKTEQRCYGKPKGKEDDDEPGNGGDDSDQQGGEQGASLDLEDYRGIAAFHAERIDASNVEIRWANPRAFWETFELRRRSSDSGDWIVIHSGVLSIGNIVEFTDEAADPACQYELAVIDGHGRPVSYGPIAPLESHSATAEEAFAELQRDPEPTSVARAGGHSSRGSLGLLALVLLLLSSGVARLAFARSVR